MVWNWWRFTFAAIEFDIEYRYTAWIYDLSKCGSQLHDWRTENYRTVSTKLYHQGVRQCIRHKKLPLNATFHTNINILSVGQYRNWDCSRRSKQLHRVQTVVRYVGLYSFHNSHLLHRRQSETNESSPKGIQRRTCTFLTVTVHMVLCNYLFCNRAHN